MRSAAASRKSRPGEEPPLDDDMREACAPFLPAPEMRPRIVVRFAADEKDLLVSGMLAGGRELANRPAVVDVPRGQGARAAVREQPDVAERNAGQLFPAVQRDAELRSSGRGANYPGSGFHGHG